MTAILIPIHTRHWLNIRNGVKPFELRKLPLPKHSTDRLIFYATYPVCRIIGEATLYSTHVCALDDLWRMVWDGCCLSLDEFNKYYNLASAGVAFRIKDVYEYRTTARRGTLPSDPPFAPTQRFRYVSDKDILSLHNDIDVIHVHRYN